MAAGGGGKGGMAAEVGVDTAVEVGGPLMAGPAGTMEGPMFEVEPRSWEPGCCRAPQVRPGRRR